MDKKLELLSGNTKHNSPEKMEIQNNMIEKIENQTEKIGVQTEKIVPPIEKIIQNTEKIDKDSEIIVKKYRGNRGPDKKPRRINENSIRNLKPFSSISEKIQNKSNNSSLKLSSKILILFFIIFVMIIGWHIWKYYKARQACNLDNLGVEK